MSRSAWLLIVLQVVLLGLGAALLWYGLTQPPPAPPAQAACPVPPQTELILLRGDLLACEHRAERLLRRLHQLKHPEDRDE